MRYSTPPGLVGTEVWVRVEGEELVITFQFDDGLVEVARHRLSTPGNPRIDLAHYPDHPQQPDGSPRPPRPRARNRAEEAFLSLGPGPQAWSVEAAATGAQKVRSKMAAAVELAALVGIAPVHAEPRRPRPAAEAGRGGVPCPGLRAPRNANPHRAVPGGRPNSNATPTERRA